MILPPQIRAVSEALETGSGRAEIAKPAYFSAAAPVNRPYARVREVDTQKNAYLS